MVVKNTTLTFATENQSLWAAGQAREFRISTNDLLIYNPGEVTPEAPFSFDIYVAGVSGLPYMNFRTGLEFWAELADSGHFDAQYEIDVAVQYTPGIDVTKTQTQSDPASVTFDLSTYTIRSAEISSQGFSGSPGAGLDFIIDVEVGLRNVEWYAFGASGSVDDFKIIDIDETIPIIEIRPDTEISGEIYTGIELTARLPTGANTQAISYGTTSVTASGFSDTKFIELNVDLDELFVELAGKIPKIGKVIEKVGEVLFFDESFDLADYVPYVPRGKFELSATVLDIDANAGTVLTEDVGLDIGGGDTTPDVRVFLRSDAGTPGDFTDDVVVETVLGQTADIDMPRSNQLGADGTSLVTVTGYFDLTDVEYSHNVGIGIDAALTIVALRAEFGGAWVPDSLAAQFGPLLNLTFPEGGFQAELFDFYSDRFDLVTGSYDNTPTDGSNPSTWGYNQGAFNRVTDTYEIFVTNESPYDWDPESPNAAQVVYEYKVALAQNRDATIEEFGDLWNNSGTQDVENLQAGYNLPAPGASNTSRFWYGNTDSRLTMYANSNNYTVVNIDPAVAVYGGVLGATVGAPGGIGFSSPLLDLDPNSNSEPTYVYADTSIDYKVALLNGLSTAIYSVYEFSATGKQLKSQHTPQVKGGIGGDVIVMKDAEGKLFDGGGNPLDPFGAPTIGDYFIADFAHIYGNTAITFDSTESNFGTGIVIGGATIRNFESFVLRTGGGDDYLSGGYFVDWFDTGAGEDFVQLEKDSESDFVYLGADDDVAFIRFNWTSRLGEARDQILDDIYGGTGFDIGVFKATNIDLDPLFDDYSNPHPDIVVKIVINGVETATGDSFSDLSLLWDVLDTHDGGDFGETVADQSTRDTSAQSASQRDALVYNVAQTIGGKFYSDVEAVDVIGGADSNDLVLYNGGLQYIGGSGFFTFDRDTLLADFGAYETRKGVTTGVYLLAAGREDAPQDEPVLNFADSVMMGFERLVARGTSFADMFIGGQYADGFHGGDSADVIDGGEDDIRDELHGDAGGDTFYWSDDGADIIRGGTGNDWLIVSAEEFSLGLEYGFYSAGDVVTTTPLRTKTYDATSSSNHLNAALTLYLQDVSKTVGATQLELGRGMRFGDTLGYVAADPDMYLDYHSIEHVNVIGSDAYSDLIFFEGGATYDAGGNANGPGDVFVADFSDQNVGIELDFASNDDGALLDNGVFVKGFERGVIHTGAGSDRLAGGALDDMFFGGDGSDYIQGGQGNDRIYGEGGDDVLFWDGTGSDWIDGGVDYDNLILGTDAARLVWRLSDSFFGSLNSTVVSASSSRTNIDLALGDLAIADLVTLTLAGGSILTYTGIEAVNVAGAHDYDDLLLYQGGLVNYGGDAIGDADIFAADLSASTDDLTILADTTQNAGTQTLSGADAFDASGNFTGFAGIQDIGNGSYVGGFERLHVYTGAGDDTVFGGELGDYISTGAGDDTVDSGTGGTGALPDHVLTGAGDDVLTYRGGIAVMDGGTDYDILNFEAPETGAISFAVLDGGLNQIGSTYTGGTVATGSAGRTELTALFAANPTFAPALQYNFDGGKLTYSGIEELSIQGSDQDDFLVAPLRSGNLFGGDGDDVLVSSLGIDIMVGGAGLDTYAFANGDGIDYIARETFQGGRVYFNNLAQADVNFTISGDDLHIIQVGAGLATVVVYDYFATGGNGLDFEFSFTDFDGRLDLSHLTTPLSLGKTGGTTATKQTLSTPGITAIGTAGDDDLTASFSTGDDDLFGLGGSDFFAGSAGADLINGGADSDVVSYYENATSGVGLNLIYRQGTFGIANGDVLVGIEDIFGTAFADTLVGDRADNGFFGGEGNDFLVGNGGDDLLAGNKGSDDIYGNDGDDNLQGDNGRDYIDGGANNDYIDGGAGNDTLLGQGGDDTLIGGTGTDTADGGVGDDTYVHGGGYDADTGTNDNGVDTFDGGADTDTLDLSEYEFAVRVVQGLGGSDGIFTDLTDAFNGAIAEKVLNVSNVEQFVGTDFNDTFEIFSAGLVAASGAGDDYFTAGAGSQTLLGGSGTDTLDLNFSTGAPQLVSVDLTTGLVNDLSGSTDTISGFERFIGTAGADSFVGDDTSSVFEDKGGADSANLGAGNDTVIAGVDAVGTNDSYHGDAGFDMLDYSAATNDLFVDLYFDQAYDNGGVGIGSDTISGFESAITGSGNDVVYGSAKSDVIDGGAGDDTLYGDHGNDVVIGGLGDDTLFGDRNGPSAQDGDFDILDYSRIGQSIDLDLTRTGSEASGAGIGTDTFTEFEAYVTGLGDDVFKGDGAAQTFFVTGGNGLGGRDEIDGRGGDDTADFSDFASAIHVDLQASVEVSTRDAEDLDPARGALRDVADLTGIEFVVLTDFSDTMLGTAAAERLAGGQGNDFLTGRAGADTLFGDEGLDTVDYSTDGGAAGVTVDLSGLAGVISTGKGARAVDTHGDLDQLNSIEGVIGTDQADAIFGSTAGNVLQGGLGADTLIGMAGRNVLFGGDAGDLIMGGIDIDTIYGERGADIIDGGKGDDQLSGGAGADQITGGIGSDTILGGDGADTLNGEDGADSLDGGDANDTLNGGANDDLLAGGAGDDTLDGGDQTDTVDYSADQAGVSVDLQTGSATDGSGDTDTLISIENVLGSGHADTLDGDNAANVIADLDGDDTIRGRGGNDVFLGGTGTDSFNGNSGFDLLRWDFTASDAGDFVYLVDFKTGYSGEESSAVGADSVTNIEAVQVQGDIVMKAFGDNLANTFIGGNGADVLRGRAGSDILIGGVGADRLLGQSGRDTADYSASDAAISINLRAGTGQGGHASGDALVKVENIVGSAFADILTGFDANEELSGGGGDDTIKGNGGRDILNGGDNSDLLNGGGGDDVLNGDAGADVLTGRGGHDVLNGGSGNDDMTGNGGDDILSGGDGDDILSGQGNNDTLTGGSDADTFVFDRNRFGNDIITDFEDDIDTIEIVDSIWGGGLSAAEVLSTFATQNGAHVLIDFGFATLDVRNTAVSDLENDLSFI